MLNLSISNCHDSFFPSSYESSLLDDGIEYFFIPKMKNRNRKRKLRSWQRIQSVPAGKEMLPAEKDQNTNQGRKNRKRKKGTGRHLKRKPKTERVFTKPTIHSGPRYNISKMELKRAYMGMRKGNRFYASWSVLWKNRFNIVLGCANYYSKGNDDVTYVEEIMSKMLVKEWKN